MTSLKDHDSDCDLDNHEIYMKHRQQQCVQTCYLPTHDGLMQYIHTWDQPIPMTEDSRSTVETTDLSKLAGIHKPHRISPSQLYGKTGLHNDSKCAVSDCNRSSVSDYNRPTVNVPMVECSVPSSTLFRTKNGKVKRPIPCETPGYFVLEHQS